MTKKITSKDSFLIGVISDTHGHLSPLVGKAFGGMDLIIHAGDIGEAEILESLEKIAPTIAVRGNMDLGHWARKLPTEESIEVNQTLLVVLHDVCRLKLKPDSANPNIVISGHTHRALLEERQDVLYLNPGSAGFPKFGQPATVAVLQINNDSVSGQFVPLE